MKRPARNGDEQDCFYARKFLKVFDRAGVAAKTKKRARRRERRETKKDKHDD
jgi:hypothetical protein